MAGQKRVQSLPIPRRTPAAAARADARSEPLAPADAARFRQIVLAHLDAAYGFARYLCHDAALAEEIVQDACLRALRGFAGYRGGDPKAWLLAIVRSSHAEGLRRTAHLQEDPLHDIAEEPADEAPSAEAALVRAADDRAVRAAVDALPDPFREAIVLREVEDMSYLQIADIAGVPIGTVMSRLARARRLLLTALSPEARR